MTLEIKVPVLPESVADASIATWYKKIGEPVLRDEKLVDIETDKVVLEVVAPEEGMLETILKPVGSTVNAEEVIAMFQAKKAGTVAAATVMPAPTVASPAAHPIESAPPAAPSVRRLMAEHDVSPSDIKGSGKSGRITKDDVIQTLHPTGRVEKRVPMSRLRARIAERLLQAQQTAAILTTFNEINMQPIMTLRQNYKDSFEKKFGIRLGFMSFFTLAVIEALKRFPAVNASIDGNDIVYHGYYDIGIAVSSPRGLVVPIIRDADQLTIADLERHIAEYGKKAQEGQLTIEELTGGTFTISNGGVFGSLMSTPILNPPQSGILGMHKIQERPMVEKGEIVIRPMMYVALSYDHRMIDGAESVRFLVTIKEMLEDPARLLLGV